MDKKMEVKSLNEPIFDIAFENMLKQFTYQVKKEGILEEFRSRRYYMKPSEKRRIIKRGNKNGR